MDVPELIESALLLVGSALVLLAAVGIFRMPDLIIRLHSTSKAATLGAALMLCAVAVHFGDIAVITRVTAVIVFLFITAPVAAHMLARASYFLGVPLSGRPHMHVVGFPLAAHLWSRHGAGLALRFSAVTLAAFLAVTLPFLLPDPARFTPFHIESRLGPSGSLEP